MFIEDFLPKSQKFVSSFVSSCSFGACLTVLITEYYLKSRGYYMDTYFLITSWEYMNLGAIEIQIFRQIESALLPSESFHVPIMFTSPHF